MGYLKINLKKINKRKIFGTILGIAFWTACILFFTYAYYEWKSTNTNVLIAIEEVATQCLPGADVNINNIGPVLDYRDGVKTEFSIENGLDDVIGIDLRLDIESISDTLLTSSFKYALIDVTGGITNESYINPILTGTFEEFLIGSNIIITSLEIEPLMTESYAFIVYIDGNEKNEVSMQENSMVANLMIGNCEESTNILELSSQAIYSSSDNSLTFVRTKTLEVGDVYNGKIVDAVYTGFDTTIYSAHTDRPWYQDGVYDDITIVIFKNKISPISTKEWFNSFTSLTEIIGLEKLDTSNVTNMTSMFYGCSNLTSIDLSNAVFDKVTSYDSLFSGVSNNVALKVKDQKQFIWIASKFNSLTNIFYDGSRPRAFYSSTDKSLTFINNNDLVEVGSTYKGKQVDAIYSEFDLRTYSSHSERPWYKDGVYDDITIVIFVDEFSVVSTREWFTNCANITNIIGLEKLDTSNVINMQSMFYGCKKLTTLNLSNFDTSNVTVMAWIFNGCSGLTSIDFSNAVFDNVTSYGNMFNGVSNNVALKVKDETQANWISTKFTNLTNIIVSS